MTFREALNMGEEQLASCGIADAAIDAWYLLEYILKDLHCDRTWFLMNREDEMPEARLQSYREVLRKRASHIPLQHITGEQEFMGLNFAVNEHVLVPRQDTEILVEETLKFLKPGMKVLDMCTGSGCIIISLMEYAKGITGTGADISGEALKVARKNAANLGADVRFVESDLFSNIEGQYDCIVSNPPYIPTADIEQLENEVKLHDPWNALDGMEDGLHFYRRIVEESGNYLKTGGELLFEIGCEQAEQVSALMREAGYSDIVTIKDLAGLDRVVRGRK